MLKRRTALAVILALSLVLAACGGSSNEDSSVREAQTPASTQPSTEMPQAEATPAGNEAGGDVADTGGAVDMAEHLRGKTMRMWEVYNSHVPEDLEQFYSADYWEEEKDVVRINMQPFKNMGLQFTAEETSPPTEIEPGKWEYRQTARFQGGLVNMVFIYEQFDGEWLLTFAKAQ